MRSASRHRQFVRRRDSRSLIERPLIERPGQRFISLLVLLGMLCTFFPLPAPPVVVSGTALDSAKAGPIEKDRSRPFPCAHRVCGCRSAEQCWKKCCCFTDAQKVAWADAQGVELPLFVRESAARAQHGDARTAERGKSPGSRACARCERETPAARREGGTEGTRVGDTVKSAGASAGRAAQPAGPEIASGVVIVQDALACQGIDWQWQFAPGTAPRSPVVDPGVEPPPVALPAPAPQEWCNPSSQVPVPPPRVSLSAGSSAQLS